MLLRFIICFTIIEISTFVITQDFIRGVIYSILIGNCGSSNKAHKISHTQSIIERLEMKYIQNYINEYLEEYNFYMKFARIYAYVWLSIFISFLLIGSCLVSFDTISVDQFAVIWSFKCLLNCVFLFVFYIFHYDSDKKTKFDRKTRKS